METRTTFYKLRYLTAESGPLYLSLHFSHNSRMKVGQIMTIDDRSQSGFEIMILPRY